jgi:large subunit ribosomal protein L10
MKATGSTATREKKVQRVAEIQGTLKTAKMAIVTEFRGLSVTQMSQLRRQLREAAGEYQVIKNALVRRALKDTPFSSLDSLLDGPNGWVFGYEDPVLLSKTLVKYIGENEKLKIKGGWLEGEFLDQAKVKLLAQMPSRAELQAKLLALMQAPATQLLRVVQAPGAGLVRLLEAARKQKAEASAS